MVSQTLEYPPQTAPSKYIVRARDREGTVLHFPSIKPQDDFAAAKKIALRVAKRSDAHDVQVLTIPGER